MSSNVDRQSCGSEWNYCFDFTPQSKVHSMHLPHCCTTEEERGQRTKGENLLERLCCIASHGWSTSPFSSGPTAHFSRQAQLSNFKFLPIFSSSFTLISHTLFGFPFKGGNASHLPSPAAAVVSHKGNQHMPQC